MARERGGRSFLGQVTDLLRLSRGEAQLEAREYYAYRLYQADRDRASFVGRRAIQHLLFDVVRSPWPPIATDQLAVHAMLAGVGLPVPELLAVWAPFRHTGVPTWRTPEDAQAGLAALDGPLFLKPVDAHDGDQVLSVDRVDGTDLVLADDRRAPIPEVVAGLSSRAAGAGVQVQRRLTPHPDVAVITGDRLATVRMLWLVDGSGPHLHRAVWRIPTGIAPCDAPWRPGNLLAGLHPVAGTVSSVTRGLGPDRKTVERHPDSGHPLDVAIPGWAHLYEATRRAAASVPWAPIQAWDVAYTDRGPVLLELEADGGDPLQTQLPFDTGWADDRWRSLVSALTARAAARDTARPRWWAAAWKAWTDARS